MKNKLTTLWQQIYGETQMNLLNDFLVELEAFKAENQASSLENEWYRDVTVYSLYVDLFNQDFQGLTQKLDYLQELGVSCLWLLPILDSPMRDAGFDIKDYRQIRPELTGEGGLEVFKDFVQEAHKRKIKVIFDIAINHTSDEHPWFIESKKGIDNPYRDFYIWNNDDQKYQDARIIFYGIEESNWQKEGNDYFFHRFFDFQPDLNYRNPQVILEMSRNFLHWLRIGVDGFRADAIPYLWKEEGTDCENLPMTHTIVKFFRAVLDMVRPNTLLLAEACQKPHEVVKYFGKGDECHAGYHFPLMPQMFKAIAAQSSEPITKTLSLDVTPSIPEGSQWFTFLRCHDELSLELVYVSEEDRKYIHESYCKKPEWDFRLGQGISSRLSELMDRDPKKIALIYSVMLTLPGTPVLYYGDEFAKLNDLFYYKEQIQLTGKDDTRFLVRGRLDWESIEEDLKDTESLTFKVNTQVKKMLQQRNKLQVFGRGDLEWLPLKNPQGEEHTQVLSYIRALDEKAVLLVHNLSAQEQEFQLPEDFEFAVSIFGQLEISKKHFKLKAHGFDWLVL
jgi:maltose alpha-D-glucosyltransferase/alpha-amylase